MLYGTARRPIRAVVDFGSLPVEISTMPPETPLWVAAPLHPNPELSTGQPHSAEAEDEEQRKSANDHLLVQAANEKIRAEKFKLLYRVVLNLKIRNIN